MNILLFGGTTEGREKAAQLTTAGENVLVCVASEDGRKAMTTDVKCNVGRLDAEQMVALALEWKADKIVDATHPFAKVVSENARCCADRLNLPYERVERSSDNGADFSEAVTWVDSAEEAARSLLNESGNVFLSTGSNTAAVYAGILPVERLYVRVLPNNVSLDKCEAAGFHPSHIVAMQGPFTEEFNRALYAQWHIAHLITKDSGSIGGVREKVLPALEMGINVVIIKRPKQEN